MTKKISCVIVLLLAFVCAFASCGDNKGATSNEPPAHTHNFGEWETVKAATCTAEGSKERYCSCGEKQSTSLPIMEHSYGEWKTIKNATCTEEGSKDGYCSCGKKQSVSIPATGHSYSNWETTKDATFSEKGSESRRCNCGETETRDIPKKQPEIMNLEATECLKDLNTVYLNSLSQKTVWFDEDGWIYARYFDGVEDYAYFTREKDGEAITKWYGKVNGTYYYLEERVTSTETVKTYKGISELEMISAVENAGNGFQYLEYAISLVEEASVFSCQKTTDENGTKYNLKLITDENFENITITTVNGLITVYDHEDYTIATYSYDKIITMPLLNDFTPVN